MREVGRVLEGGEDVARYGREGGGRGRKVGLGEERTRKVGEGRGRQERSRIVA